MKPLVLQFQWIFGGGTLWHFVLSCLWNWENSTNHDILKHSTRFKQLKKRDRWKYFNVTAEPNQFQPKFILKWANTGIHWNSPYLWLMNTNPILKMPIIDPEEDFIVKYLLLAGRALRLQKDLNFSLDNLLLAKDEAQALAVERELWMKLTAPQGKLCQPRTPQLKPLNFKEKGTKSTGIRRTCRFVWHNWRFQPAGASYWRNVDVATNESTQKRLDKNYFKLNAFELRNWHGILRRFADDNDLFHNWKNLIIRGKS